MSNPLDESIERYLGMSLMNAWVAKRQDRHLAASAASTLIARSRPRLFAKVSSPRRTGGQQIRIAIPTHLGSRSNYELPPLLGRATRRGIQAGSRRLLAHESLAQTEHGFWLEPKVARVKL
jgi:hypothetical protein